MLLKLWGVSVSYLSKLDQVVTRARLRRENTVVIYDRVLDSAVPGFGSFVSKFGFRFAVDSGESLKTVESFGSFCEMVSRASLPPARSMTVLACGGGSVGDFAGFFASVWKRGVRLVHVPTTWLAAIDSAHGGKTALNVGGAKNQIGTFYPASAVACVRPVFPESSVADALGELAKIALIDGGPWVRQLERSRLHGSALMWKFLKPAVDSKMRVVRRDPTESSGVRQVLNLGHTMGHVLEAASGLSHGAAVAQGVFFALEFSLRQGLLNERAYERAMSLMGGLGLVPSLPRGLSASVVERLLLADKKRASTGRVTFIFLRAIGRCERREIAVSDVVREARRQGWIS